MAWRPGVWSNHAFGAAIDVNPLYNPYVSGDFVDPAAAAAYVDRADIRPGMIADGDAAVVAFAEAGWIWGGHWAGAKDYQHFSANAAELARRSLVVVVAEFAIAGDGGLDDLA